MLKFVHCVRLLPQWRKFERSISVEFFKWSNTVLFFVFFRLFKQTLQFLQQIGTCEKMSIQYLVLEFEPTTFRIWVSSHNQLTRAPAQLSFYLILIPFKHKFIINIVGRPQWDLNSNHRSRGHLTTTTAQSLVYLKMRTPSPLCVYFCSFRI